MLNRALRGEVSLAWMIVFAAPGLLASASIPWISAGRLARALSARDRRADRVRAAAAQALGSLGGPECVAPLVLALRDGSADVRAASDRALSATLPRIGEIEPHEAPEDFVPGLCRLLGASGAGHKREAVRLLRFAGDRRALRPLAALASASGASETGRSANEAIAAIRQRAARSSDRDWLLRPAHPPALDDRHLRPAELALTPVDYREEVLPPT